MPASSVTLYHLTSARNLPRIMREGLRPLIGPRARRGAESRALIYCFANLADLDQALANWLGEELGEQTLALLKIRLPKGIRTKHEAFEVQVAELIPPDAIEIVSRDYGS